MIMAKLQWLLFFSTWIDRFSDNFRENWDELIRFNVAYDYKLQILDNHLLDYFA